MATGTEADAALAQRDAVIAQRDLQLAKLLEAHRALVERFERIDAARAAKAAALVDAQELLSMAEQEIAARVVHARGMRQTLQQCRGEIRQLQQRLDEGAASAAPVVPAPDAAVVAQLEELRHQLVERDRRLVDLVGTLEASRRDLAEAEARYEQVVDSRSWKLTRPLRGLSALLGPRKSDGAA